jgi:nitrite reductase/ring-hydroxylating ferredoxin subunit
MNENVKEEGITSNEEGSQVTVDIASVQDVPNGKMKHVKVDEKEILIANVNGNYYAISDRCGHSNASLSKGKLNGNVVTCPLHGAQFDVTTGRKVKDFNLDVPSFDKLPDDFKRYTQYALELVSSIKIHDQEKHELVVENDRIKMRFPTTSN